MSHIIEPKMTAGSNPARAACLCCIGRASETELPEGDGYESDQRLTVVDEGELRAVVIEMDASYLSGTDAAERLEDVDWLVPRAQRHEEIITAASAHGPVVPARFGCLFSDVDRLRDMLASHEDVLSDALDRVRGTREHTVRLLLDRDAAIDAMLAEEGDEAAISAGAADSEGSDSGGAEWMLARRRRRDAGKRVGPWLAEHVGDLTGMLEDASSAACRHRITEKSRDGLEVIANWAFLVSDEDHEDFAAALEEASDELDAIGVRSELSGPWPPYSFAPSVAAE